MAHIDFLDNIVVADIAFEVKSDNLPDLFAGCGLAVTSSMVDPSQIKPSVSVSIKKEADNLDDLLFEFLEEIVYLKDAKSLVFREFSCSLDKKNGKAVLLCQAKGERIKQKKHTLRNDVKAVTLHRFGIKKGRSGFKASVVLDI